MLPGSKKRSVESSCQLDCRMRNSHIVLPNQKNYGYAYEFAYELACEQLAKIEGIEQLCLKSGAQYQMADSQKVIILEYLNRTYQITFPDIKVSSQDNDEEVPIKDKVLILHYLTLAKGIPLTNKLIAFKELPEGSSYFPTFAKRTVKPILNHFGDEPNSLIDTAERLGGHEADYGDVAVTINAFSRVPITLVLWRGDEEFAPEGNILFDSTISDYLATEDITILCETIVWRLIKYLKGGVG